MIHYKGMFHTFLCNNIWKVPFHDLVLIFLRKGTKQTGSPIPW
jgi:hypothetical protein